MSKFQISNIILSIIKQENFVKWSCKKNIWEMKTQNKLGIYVK
jgi:hypothetical protein